MQPKKVYKNALKNFSRHEKKKVAQNEHGLSQKYLRICIMQSLLVLFSNTAFGLRTVNCLNFQILRIGKKFGLKSCLLCRQEFCKEIIVA